MEAVHSNSKSLENNESEADFFLMVYFLFESLPLYLFLIYNVYRFIMDRKRISLLNEDQYIVSNAKTYLVE
jgi:flagellar biogenesis protein FliO